MAVLFRRPSLRVLAQDRASSRASVRLDQHIQQKKIYLCTDYVSYRYFLKQNSRNELLFLDFNRQNTRERISLAY